VRRGTPAVKSCGQSKRFRRTSPTVRDRFRRARGSTLLDSPPVGATFPTPVGAVPSVVASVTGVTELQGVAHARPPAFNALRRGRRAYVRGHRVPVCPLPRRLPPHRLHAVPCPRRTESAGRMPRARCAPRAVRSEPLPRRSHSVVLLTGTARPYGLTGARQTRVNRTAPTDRRQRATENRERDDENRPPTGRGNTQP
jgi:hypothetical protein